MQTLPAARWSCHACGACCSDFRLGPVEPEVVRDLKARGADALAGFEDWAREEPGPDGQPGWFLAHVDGHCAFLLPDKRCAIHAAWGAATKPGFCQEFPYRRLRDPNGEVLVIRAECAGFHRSFVDGQALSEQTAATAALPRLGPLPEFAPQGVPILPGVGASLAEWMTLEAELLRVCASWGGDGATLTRTLAERAYRALGRTRPEGRPSLAFGAVREAMRMIANQAASQPAPEPWQQVLITDVQRVLSAEGDGTVSDEADRYLQHLIAQGILGKHLVAAGGFVPMLGRFAFERELVRRAGADTAAQASANLIPWLRFVDNPQVLALLRRTTPALLELV